MRPSQRLDVAQNGLHLVQSEAQGLHAADDENPVDVVLGVEAEATVGASGRAEQADLVPMAQAAQRELGAGGDLADVHGRGSGLRLGLAQRGDVVGHGDLTPFGGFQPYPYVRVGFRSQTETTGPVR